MKKNVLFALAISTAISSLLTMGNGSSVQAAEKIIKFGAPLPLTGGLAPEGIKIQRGLNLWMETANAKGGIKVGSDRYKIKIIYQDYQSNTPRAVQTAEKLITDDKVNFLFSPFGSGATKAASGVSEKYGIPTIASTASSEAVYNQGYKYLFGTFTPNISLTQPLTDLVIAKRPATKTVAILARNDFFPLAIANVMKKSAAKRNLKLVFFEKYTIGTMDHSSAVVQMKAAKPDWIFATGYLNDLILIRNQMSELGVKVPVLTMVAGPAYKEFIDGTGKLAENITSAAWWHPAVRYNGKGVMGKTENFNKLFKAKYNLVPDYAEASATAAGIIFQLAIETAGTLDHKKVRDALATMDTETFFGPIKFGANGQISSLKPPVFQIRGGKPLVVYPDVIKQIDLKFGIK